jgi:hypothetical protein
MLPRFHIPFHVQPDPVAETVFADITFEHGQYTGAFVVGNAVKSTNDLVVVIDRFANLASGRQGIFGHREQRILQSRTIEFAFRPVGMCCLVHDPARERFIEPDIVPPVRRDQVTEPHVPQLVCVHPGKRAPLIERRVFIHEQQVFVVGDRPYIFHCTAKALRHGDEIEFPVRIRRAEILLEDRQYAIGMLQRVLQSPSLAFCGNSAFGAIVP